MAKSVINFVDELQSRGRYSFAKTELEKHAFGSKEAIKSGLRRLVDKNRIVSIRKGFYVIIPLEYQKSGILPATWFIDQLMSFLKQPYYVGLLSAAALYGASHQQPQVFHVVVGRQLQPLLTHGLKIIFFKKNNILSHDGINKIKTETGYIDISSPELTALDLMRYHFRIGGMDFAAGVIAELIENMKAPALLKTARKEKSMVYIQRLGYVLDRLGEKHLTSKLHQWFSKQKSNCIPLIPTLPSSDTNLNKKWNIFVNKEIEVDEL